MQLPPAAHLPDRCRPGGSERHQELPLTEELQAHHRVRVAYRGMALAGAGMPHDSEAVQAACGNEVVARERPADADGVEVLPKLGERLANNNVPHRGPHVPPPRQHSAPVGKRLGAPEGILDGAVRLHPRGRWDDSRQRGGGVAPDQQGVVAAACDNEAAAWQDMGAIQHPVVPEAAELASRRRVRNDHNAILRSSLHVITRSPKGKNSTPMISDS
mmetsp:Transcript_129535/g.375189  ORF Transcript_129535/g.375189 Transcript_129535/m.375189 type:complete len:216 (-) Transcript_129535:332-979(-)